MTDGQNEDRVHYWARVAVSRNPGATDPSRNGRRAVEFLSWHADRAPRGHHDPSAYRRAPGQVHCHPPGSRRTEDPDREVSVDYPHLTEDVQRGGRRLLSDGGLELEVSGPTGEDVHCRVITGGTLASRKGIKLPARSITTPTVTEKDRDDLTFGPRHGVDYVAQSFVRTAADVLEVRGMIHDHGSTVPLIAKIETQDALTNIDEIIDSVDGVMVARGDLGVAIPLAPVPRLQKMLIAKANRAGKPVITATQMLRSMQDSPRPTRAEVTDEANAVLDGTDAIMLSEEAAIGRFPLEAVRMMAAIAADAESAFPFEAWIHRFETGGPRPAAGERAGSLGERERRPPHT